MGINEIIDPFIFKTQFFESQLTENEALVIAWLGEPNYHLILTIQKIFFQRNIIFLLFSSKNEIKQSFLRNMEPLHQIKSNFTELLNPIGTTVIPINEKLSIWYITEQYRNFFDENKSFDKVLSLNFDIQISQENKTRPWQARPPSINPFYSAIVVGSGIAGANTAFSLASKGISVLLLEESHSVATLGSGNYQGILYTKISPHLTLQTQLLLLGYSFSLSSLQQVDSEYHFWKRCGVLHLDHIDDELKRNQKLSQWNTPLFHHLNQEEASFQAGIPLHHSALFWKNGGWVHPKSWIQKLLKHPLIEVKLNSKVVHIEKIQSEWSVVLYDQTVLKTKALFLCQGGLSNQFSHLLGLNYSLIRGQTSLAKETEKSHLLKSVLSARSYISPSWQNLHCFGATFIPNNTNTEWSSSDQKINKQELNLLSPELFTSFEKNNAFFQSDEKKGHVAIRCDSFDHLPVVGPVGDYKKMLERYAKLALDKNYNVQSECPYLDGLYINTAHGSRGLITAPICSESVVSEALGLPNPLPEKLRRALLPNRLIIRNIIKNKPN